MNIYIYIYIRTSLHVLFTENNVDSCVDFRWTRVLYVYIRTNLHVVFKETNVGFTWTHVLYVTRYIYIRTNLNVLLKKNVGFTETRVTVEATFVIQPPCTYGYP